MLKIKTEVFPRFTSSRTFLDGGFCVFVRFKLVIKSQLSFLCSACQQLYLCCILQLTFRTHGFVGVVFVFIFYELTQSRSLLSTLLFSAISLTVNIFPESPTLLLHLSWPIFYRDVSLFFVLQTHGINRLVVIFCGFQDP